MTDEEICQFQICLESCQQLQQAFLERKIEAGKRLIEDQEGTGTTFDGGQRPGNRRARALSTA